jgi:ribosomal protein L37AE/L43A
MSEITFKDIKETLGIEEREFVSMFEKNLKPCPYCGGNGLIENMGFPHWITCCKCGARVHGKAFGDINGMIESVKAWNRRCKETNYPWTVGVHIRNIETAAKERLYIGDNCQDDHAGGIVYSIHFGPKKKEQENEE